MKAAAKTAAKKPAAKAASNKPKVDVYQMLTDRFVAKMEAGLIPWQKPWQSYGPARNFASGHVYTGINALLLPFLCDGIPLFVTFLQAKELGGNIRAGAKGLPVVYYNVVEKENVKGEGDDKKEKIPFIRYTTVFSVSDVENVVLDLPELDQRPNEPIAAAQAVVESWGQCPRIEHKEQRAFYVPSLDYVNMPLLSSFVSAEAYYSVLFHELTHSTGHKSRLFRADLADSLGKGSAGYAREELTAELGAAFLCHLVGINPALTEENTTAYLQHWLGHLKNDKKLLVQAAGHAAKAANMIQGIESEPHGADSDLTAVA